MFKSAVFVITTHGAAELFLTFIPKEACVIEYNYPLTANMVYARLALTLRLNYRMNAIYEFSAANATMFGLFGIIQYHIPVGKGSPSWERR